MSGKNATADTNDTRPNSSCPICPPGICLCEIEINDIANKKKYYWKSIAKLKEPNTYRMPRSIICLGAEDVKEISLPNWKKLLDFLAYKSTNQSWTVPGDNFKARATNAKTKIDTSNGLGLFSYTGSFVSENKYIKDLNFMYEVMGECEHENVKCVKPYFTEYGSLLKDGTQIRSTVQTLVPLIDKSLLTDRSADFRGLNGQLAVDYNKDETKQVYVTINNDNELFETFKEENPGILEVFRLARGLMFLLFGKLVFLPANVYRFGVMTCDGKEGKDVGTEAYTDFFVIPNYKIAFKGNLFLSAFGARGGRVAQIEITETIDGKKTGALSLSYDKYKRLGEDEKYSDPFWKSLVRLTNFLETLYKIANPKEALAVLKEKAEALGDAWDKAKEDVAKEDKERLMNPKSNRLYKLRPHIPSLEIYADAKLESAMGKMVINRERFIEPEIVEKANEEDIISPDGVVNEPNSVIDIAKRKEYMDKLLGEKKSYLKIDSLIGGTLAINMLDVLQYCGVVGKVLRELKEFTNFDMFNEFNGNELKFDAMDDRTRIMAKSSEAILAAKGYCFFSTDISFSPIFNFHNSYVDEYGGDIEIEGSFGLGVALGAKLETDIVVYRSKYIWQGAYGMRVYFSVDWDSGVATFWTDGLTAESKSEVHQSIQEGPPIEQGRGRFNTSAGNGEHTVTKSSDNSLSIKSDISGKSTSSTDLPEERKIEYDPQRDLDFDNPHIVIPTVYDEGLWGTGLFQDPSVWGKFPNRASKYYDPNSEDQKWMDEFLSSMDEYRRKRILKDYDKELQKHERKKQRLEGSKWIPATTRDNPAWTYKIGDEVENNKDIDLGPNYYYPRKDR